MIQWTIHQSKRLNIQRETERGHWAALSGFLGFFLHRQPVLMPTHYMLLWVWAQAVKKMNKTKKKKRVLVWLTRWRWSLTFESPMIIFKKSILNYPVGVQNIHTCKSPLFSSINKLTKSNCQKNRVCFRRAKRQLSSRREANPLSVWNIPVSGAQGWMAQQPPPASLFFFFNKGL